MPRSAIEFFSGIGAFSQAARRHGIEVIAAYDQSASANQVFSANNHLSPSVRNLDTIGADHIPPADIWWLSPPCKPYTVRGKQRDDQDTRAASLKQLLRILPQRLPKIVLLENVAAFENSRMHALMCEQLQDLGYQHESLRLCPTMFGVPMRRPRFFLIAYTGDAGRRLLRQPPRRVPRALTEYLEADACGAAALKLPAAIAQKYMQGFDIIDETDAHAQAICFTSGYAKCMRAGGSMLRDTAGNIRRFSPSEMLRLFGFPDDFQIPADLPLDVCWRLIGNSVDVRCIDYLLNCLIGTECDTTLAASET
ncbi:MAG TPA: DNA cytosine methyltransferase [Candidatus Obscuribacterales bacterium]